MSDFTFVLAVVALTAGLIIVIAWVIAFWED